MAGEYKREEEGSGEEVEERKARREERISILTSREKDSFKL